MIMRVGELHVELVTLGRTPALGRDKGVGAVEGKK
jgi:hypothetical protein